MGMAFSNGLNEGDFFNRFVLVSGHSASHARYQYSDERLVKLSRTSRLWGNWLPKA
jgi:hypothetical protein